MNTLVVYAHPNPKSFAHAILETATQTLAAQGHTVVVRDLYQLGFSPILSAEDFAQIAAKKVPADIQAEQEHIRWADLIVVIHPLWWTGMPAILKGYFDRTLLNGFAFSYGPQGPKGLLEGKKALLFTNQGTPAAYYDQSGMTTALQKTSDVGIFQFCGIEVIGHHFFGGVPSADDATRKQYLEQVKQALKL